MVGDVVERYIRDHVDLNRRGATQRWALKPILDHFGRWPLLDLNTGALRDYRRIRARRVADPTIRREMGALRAALSWAKDNDVAPKDWSIPTINLPPPGAPRENCLTEAEAQKLWDAAVAIATGPDPFPRRRVGLFTCLALDTAARSAAIEGLTWDRVDVVRGLIDFRDPGKSVSKKRRVPVPMSDRLLAVMQDAHARRMSKGAGELHVLGHTGSTHKPFNRLVDLLGLDCTRHDLRRTWATLKARRGVSMFEIAGVLGDKLETVMKHYAHHSPEHLRGAVNA
jgi:integrase